MNILAVCMRPVGRLLLRCLVGKYGTIVWMGALAALIGVAAYLSLAYDHTASSGTDEGPVYSVAAVDAHLAQNPGPWLGRTIQVRGEIVPCMAVPSAGGGPCAALTSGSGSFGQFGQPLTSTVYPLPITHAGLDPMRSIVRRIPLLGRLAPAPQELQWGVVATYQVQLAFVPNSMCGVGACAEARLLDSAP